MPKLPNPLRLALLVAGSVAYSICVLIILSLPSQPNSLDDLIKALSIVFITSLFALTILAEDYLP